MARRRRSRVNRDLETGINNRQGGMCRKAHSLFTEYKADVVVIIRRPDGRYGGYQSKRGLLKELLQTPEDCLLTPREMKMPTRPLDRLPSQTGESSSSTSPELSFNTDLQKPELQSPSTVFFEQWDTSGLSSSIYPPHDESKEANYNNINMSSIFATSYADLEDKRLKPKPISPNTRKALKNLLEMYL